MSRLSFRVKALAASGTLLGALLLGTLPGTVLAVGPVTHYAFSVSPIATAGSLPANYSKVITVTAKDITGAYVPNSVIFLSISDTTGGGSAAVGTVALTTSPVGFTATTGQLSITYKTPSILPTGGKDIIKAANLKSLATISATDLYSYSKVTKYVFAATPIAPAHSLAANASVNVTLTSYNAAAAVVPGATVYLAFKPITGGGTAWVGTTALTATPTAFKANTLGQIVIVYKTPATLPQGGSDVITAQDATKNATLSRFDSYAFAPLAALVLTPSPIAATATLKGSTKVTVTLTAKDAFGNVIVDQTVYLSFVPALSGGTAFVGTKALTATPARFMTGLAGTVVVTYGTPASLPATGTDTIRAANALSSPTITASDGYTF